jgi:hypothetical protein
VEVPPRISFNKEKYMNNKLALLIILLFSLVFSQTLKDDTTAIRAIFNANKIIMVSVIPPWGIVYKIENNRLVGYEFGDIDTMPPDIGKLTALRTTTIFGSSNNKFANLPTEIKNCVALTEIDLTLNQFTTFPKELCYVKGLKKIVFRGNKISLIPPEVKLLLSLVTLDLYANELITLPKEIFELPA